MKPQLFKYKLGLGIIGVFVVILLAMLLAQAGGTKQDSQTYEKANSIADKLNTYVDANQKVPSTLADAGVKGAPATVSYQKISESSYKFCVTYKTKSSDFNAATVETNLLTQTTQSSGLYNSSSSYDNTSLNLNSSHNKGQQCQTVKPIITKFNDSTSSSSDPYAKCNSIQDNTAWEKCLQSAQGTQATTDSNGNSVFNQ